MALRPYSGYARPMKWVLAVAAWVVLYFAAASVWHRYDNPILAVVWLTITAIAMFLAAVYGLVRFVRWAATR